jgi:hypothetical protein
MEPVRDARSLRVRVRALMARSYSKTLKEVFSSTNLTAEDDQLEFATITGAKISFFVDSMSRDVWIRPSSAAVEGVEILERAAKDLLDCVFGASQTTLSLHCLSRIANLRQQATDAWQQVAALTAAVEEAKRLMEETRLEMNVWISQCEVERDLAGFDRASGAGDVEKVVPEEEEEAFDEQWDDFVMDADGALVPYEKDDDD